MKNMLRTILVVSCSFIGTLSYGMVAIQQASSRMEYNKINKPSSFGEAKAKGFARCQQRLKKEKENIKLLELPSDNYAISSMLPLPLDVLVRMVKRNKYIVIDMRGTCRFMEKEFPLYDAEEIRKEIISAQSFIDGKRMFSDDVCASFMKAISYAIVTDDRIGCWFLLKQLNDKKKQEWNKPVCLPLYNDWLKKAMSKDRKFIFRMLLKEDPFDVKNFLGGDEYIGFFDENCRPALTIDAIILYNGDRKKPKAIPAIEIERFVGLCKEYGCKTFGEIQKELGTAENELKKLEKEEKFARVHLSSYCTLF